MAHGDSYKPVEIVMPNAQWSASTRKPLPLILIRGFGGLGVEDERRVAYQGFNDGTVYTHKRGENYIYEGLILKFMKSAWQYQDATNVVGYFPSPVAGPVEVPQQLSDLPAEFFAPGLTDKSEPIYKVVIDPAMALTIRNQQQTRDSRRTLWVFRYYDLNDRTFTLYGQVLVRLIDFIRGLATERGDDGVTSPKVNIIAHSMGGLIVREAIQRSYPDQGRVADEYINKVVTLGTPHRGITFQVLRHWIGIDASQELEHFSPSFQADDNNPVSYKKLHNHFDLQRFLTVVGTNYRSYGPKLSTWANRLFSMEDEFGPNYNRSDGLVKQQNAQIPGAPRTFVHKCHGGADSLVTSRESFEIATRFFFGNVRVRLRFVEGVITRGKDFFGKSEFFFGVSIKPRRVDFDLFHQSAEAENCYGPFSATDHKGNVNFSEPFDELAFAWADEQKLIWEGYLDTSKVLPDPSSGRRDMVFRLDFYVGERDLFGVGFSDNVVFRKQYYLRALTDREPIALDLFTDERFADGAEPQQSATVTDLGWRFSIGGTGFQGTFQVQLDAVPPDGAPIPIRPEK